MNHSESTSPSSATAPYGRALQPIGASQPQPSVCGKKRSVTICQRRLLLLLFSPAIATIPPHFPPRYFLLPPPSFSSLYLPPHLLQGRSTFLPTTQLGDGGSSSSSSKAPPRRLLPIRPQSSLLPGLACVSLARNGRLLQTLTRTVRVCSGGALRSVG